MGPLRRSRRRLTGLTAGWLPDSARAAIRPLGGDEPQPVECQSCAARMQMAIEDWWCPVCGWWWAITGAAARIEAVGFPSGQDQLVVLDITGWANRGH